MEAICCYSAIIIHVLSLELCPQKSDIEEEGILGDPGKNFIDKDMLKART